MINTSYAAPAFPKYQPTQGISSMTLSDSFCPSLKPKPFNLTSAEIRDAFKLTPQSDTLRNRVAFISPTLSESNGFIGNQLEYFERHGYLPRYQSPVLSNPSPNNDAKRREHRVFESVTTFRKRTRTHHGDSSDEENSPSGLKPAKQRRGSYNLAQAIDNLALQELKEEFRRRAALEKKLVEFARQNLKKMQAIQREIASFMFEPSFTHDRCYCLT